MVGRSLALSYNARAEMAVPSNSQFALHGRRAQLSEVGVEEIQQNLRSNFSAFGPLMLFVAGKRILQTLREKKSDRKLIGIGHLFGLTHHNIFGLSNRQRQLLGQAEKRLLSYRKAI